MFIYLVTFIITYMFSKIAWSNIKNKGLFIFFSIITIILPSLIAGFRDTTVGHDIEAYMVPLFNNLLFVSNANELLYYLFLDELDGFFILFNFCITRFTDNIFWAFFIQQVIVLSLVYITCYKLRNKLNAPLLFFSYLVFYFCSSMSAARQVFAVAMIFYSFPYIIEKKIYKFLLCIIIAWTMHKSAILGITLYPLSVFCNKSNNNISMAKFTIIIIIGMLGYLYFPAILNFLISYGIVPEKYTRYIDQTFSTHKINILLVTLLFFTSTINKGLKAINNEIKIFTIVAFFILLCGVYNDVAQRAALYFILYIFTLFFCMTDTLIKQKKRIIEHSFIYLIILIYFYTSMYYGYAEAIPYTSKILGIY